MTLYKALANALYGNYLIYKRVFKFIKNHSNDILQEQDSHTEIFRKHPIIFIQETALQNMDADEVQEEPAEMINYLATHDEDYEY